MGAEVQVPSAPSPPPFPCALLREASRWRREKKKKVREKETKKKKGKQEASTTLQEMHFSNTNSFPTGSQRMTGHQLLPLPCRAPRSTGASHPLTSPPASPAPAQRRGCGLTAPLAARQGEREEGRQGGREGRRLPGCVSN